MEIIFLLNFVISMGQIIIGEREYEHRVLYLPAFSFAFLLGCFIGYRDGWELALIIFIAAFMIRFFISSLRFAVMLKTQTELGSGFYWRAFAVGALIETAALFFTFKNF